MAQYGFDKDGNEIAAPQGWRILPEGEPVPQVHREFHDWPHGSRCWCAPRRCHSTMTATHARIWGAVLAYAIPEAID
jgi:hypothetical protein